MEHHQKILYPDNQNVRALANNNELDTMYYNVNFDSCNIFKIKKSIYL